MSTKETVKVRNMNQNQNVYFSIDTDAMPNRGVKGKGTATMIKDPNKAVPLSEKIVAKYLGDINSKMAKGMIDQEKVLKYWSRLHHNSTRRGTTLSPNSNRLGTYLLEKDQTISTKSRVEYPLSWLN